MQETSPRLPRTAWRAIILWTTVITALSVLASVVISETLLNVLSQGINLAGLTVAIVLPIVLGGPMMFYQTLRHQQLKHANARLAELASTDWLTGCLNRRAFTHKVGQHLSVDGDKLTGGALLMVDADHFKEINDRYGHDRGDEALTLLAGAIQSAVRSSDVVGRVGGEEFGVFLPGAGYDMALAAAERIRDAVAGLNFARAKSPTALTVSIGGAVYAGDATFAELFRLADQRLYEAKQAGRNRVEFMQMAA